MNDYLDMKINKYETVNEIIQNGLLLPVISSKYLLYRTVIGRNGLKKNIEVKNEEKYLNIFSRVFFFFSNYNIANYN